jgi:hypothetical protein
MLERSFKKKTELWIFFSLFLQSWRKKKRKKLEKDEHNKKAKA